METNYSWKMKGLAKKVDPSTAADELRRIQDAYGAITPEVLVDEAKNPASPLHDIFEWNNKKAGHNFRIQQARILLNNIQVTIISDGEPREIAICEVTSRSEGYKMIETFSPDDVDYVRDSIKQQLGYLNNKLKTYKNNDEFEKVRYHIEQAIMCMS